MPTACISIHSQGLPLIHCLSVSKKTSNTIYTQDRRIFIMQRSRRLVHSSLYFQHIMQIFGATQQFKISWPVLKNWNGLDGGFDDVVHESAKDASDDFSYIEKTLVILMIVNGSCTTSLWPAEGAACNSSERWYISSASFSFP